jgi:hypothetical protein
VRALGAVDQHLGIFRESKCEGAHTLSSWIDAGISDGAVGLLGESAGE